VSRDELLGRARKAVLAVAGTAGALGGRVRRGQDDPPERPDRGEARPRPAPTPGLPPRIGREPAPGLPPRIERETGAPARPPRIERDAGPELPPRIRREPQPGLPPRIEPETEPRSAPPPPPAETEVTPTQSDTVYRPRHARPGEEQPPWPRPEPEAAPEPQAEEEDEGEPEQDDGPAPVPVAAASPAAGRPPRPRPAPAGPRRPSSTSSTVRDAVRPHARFLTIILVVLIAIGVGYFALRVHHRISESALESKISQRDNPQHVRCSALQSNGSAWACAIVFRAQAECVIARVNVFGSWSTVARAHRCAKITSLVALLPQKITPTAVAADVGQQLGITGLTCRKLPEHEVRWACGLPPAPGGQCLVLREVRWQTWPAQAGGRLCDHFPELETAIKASQGGT
jgi:hypothetical protein